MPDVPGMPREDADERALRGLGRLPPPPAGRELAALVARTEKVATRRPWRLAVGLGAFLLAYALTWAAWVAGFREDLTALPRAPLVVFIVTTLLGLFAHIGAALVPRAGDVLPARPGLSRFGFVLLLVAFVVAAFWLSPLADVGAAQPEFWEGTLSCLPHGLVASLVPALLGLWALPRTLPPGLWRPLGIVGGISGFVTALVIHLHCPIVAPEHVRYVHGVLMSLPAVALAVLGTLTLKR